MKNKDNNENKNIINKGFWYIPIKSKTFEDIKKKIKLNNIKYKEIGNNNVLCIDIDDETGKFDDYLSSVISELYYVQSLSKIYETNKVNDEIERIEYIDEIHNNIIYLKRLYYKGIYKLCKLSEYRDNKFTLTNFIEDCIKPFNIFYNEYYIKKYYYEIRYIFEDIISYDFYYSLKIDDFIDNLISLWTKIFCNELNIEYNYNISLNDNINAVDEYLGIKQINCLRYFMDMKKLDYDSIENFNKIMSNFIKKLSIDKNIREEYLDKEASRCFSLMWIDNYHKQYFALSGSADYEKEQSKYHEIAYIILNINRHNVKYESALFNNEIRYYYEKKSYIKYSEVESKIGELDIENYLNRMFSCCERKLLNKLAIDHKIYGKVIHIFIKYYPCKICDRALNDYKNNGFNIEIIHPKKPKKQWQQYKEIDNKIKYVFEKYKR